MEVRQTASRPRSRSEGLLSGKSHSATSKAGIEVYTGGDCSSRNSRSANSASATPSSSDAIPRQSTNSTREPDALDELRKRYSLDAIPTIQQYRVAGRVAGYKMTADWMMPRDDRNYMSLGMKMGEDPPLVKKVVLTPQFSDLRFFTPAFEFGVLQLQFSLGFDWKKRSLGASWRCKTKWTKGSKLQKKFEVLNRNHFELHTFWNIRQEFPQCGGKFSPTSSSFTQDIGRLQVDLHRLKTTINLFQAKD